jgi:hypothetical protein
LVAIVKQRHALAMPIAATNRRLKNIIYEATKTPFIYCGAYEILMFNQS